MQILLDVKDNKASSLLDVLNGLKYVKTKQLTPANTLFLSELQEAVENVKLLKKGKIKGRPIEEVLNEI